MKNFTRNSRLPNLNLLAGALIAIVLAACGGPDNQGPPLAATDKGLVQGTHTGDMRTFLGIPYAAPPVGDLRWTKPRPAASWSGYRVADTVGNVCPQAGGAFGAASTNEDCLYLNVYAPKGPGPYPVMVWVHGGAFMSGDGGTGYNASKLVARDVIVVTLNYRLGAFGFLAHPALSAEQDGSSGNYGLMDQQEALRWVKTNIANFGGDPANVTLFGESAGGYSVLAQVASPLAANLFQKAIVQSGAYGLASTASLATAHVGSNTPKRNTGTTFGTRAGCTDQTLACLRTLTATQILAAQAGGDSAPNIDNKVLTGTLAASFASGNFNKVPMLQGSNTDEYSLLSAARLDLAGTLITDANYMALINPPALGKTVAQIDAQYPRANYATAAEVYDAVYTDVAFACPGRTSARLLSSHVPTYSYEFNDRNAPMLYLPVNTRPTWGAYHASEIQYLFPTTRANITYTADQETLKTQMTSYWTQFAKTGNPNGAGPAWPEYTAANDTYMSLNPGISSITADFSARHKCAGFWSAG
jgi:para-nitrobenzyl esterase